MSIYSPTWPKINNALGSTTTEFGASDWANLISDYYNGTNLALVDATKLPVIGSLTKYKFEKLGLLDADETHSIIFSVDDIDTGAQRKIKFRRMNAPFVEDYAVLEGLSQTIINKNISGSSNTFTNIPYTSLTGAPTSITPTAHATSHKSGGSDAIKLDELAAPTDITTLNATTGLHGLLKKLSNSASQYMDGTGNWTVPQGVPGVINTLTDVDTVTAAPTNNQVLTWNSTSSQWVPATPPGSAGGEANTTSNVGTGEGTLALTKSGVNLPFKSLKQGTNITLTNNANDVTITASTGATNFDALTDVVITSPATQQLVYYNGTNFVNSTSTPFKNGLYLYHIYIDAADSKFKALNLDTLAIEFTSSGTTDALAVFNSVIAAASTAKRPVFIGKGRYPFSAQLDVSGKYLRMVGTRVGRNAGGQGDPATETILKKAYTDNTNAFIKWDASTTWSQQHWEKITIEGKDSTNNGAGTFDNGGIGFQISSTSTAIAEIYDVMQDVMICHFGTGLKLMKAWLMNFHRLCVYKCGAKGIHITTDGVNPEKSFNLVFFGGEVRYAPINVHLESSNQVIFYGTILEGDSTAPYTTTNCVKIDGNGLNTVLNSCSFENNVNGLTVISDSGLGANITTCRFGGLVWTAQTIYNATSTGSKANFTNNTIEPYANNGTATILLSAGSKHMNIIGNHVQEMATNTALTITDSSGNSTTNLILGNTSGANVSANIIGTPTTFLSVPESKITTVGGDPYATIETLKLFRNNNDNFLANGIGFDLLTSTSVRKTFGRMYAAADDNTEGIEETFIGYDYRMGGTLDRRCLIYNNGIALAPNGQRLQLFATGLTANRTYSTENFDGRLLNHNSPVTQSPLIKRSGAYQPAAGTTAATVGALSGMIMNHTPTGAGSNTTTFDATEGQIVNLVSSATANVNAGLVSTAAGGVMVRRAFKTKATIRCKIDSTTASRFYFGFTSNTVLPVTDTPLGNTEHGVIVGFNSTDANYLIRTNDGATSVTSTALSTPTAKNTSFHTITIEWTASGNIVVTFDSIVTTVATDLPGTTTNLYFNAVAQTTASAAAKTLTIKGVWIETEG